MRIQQRPYSLSAGLLVLVIGHSLLAQCSILLREVIHLSYQPLFCDDDYYRQIKETSLLVKVAFQVKDQQYLITNQNVIRRTREHAQIYYANHTDETEEFYNFLKGKNTFVQFRDYLYATTMSVKVAVSIFGHRQTKTLELQQAYKLDDQCTVKDCLNFFYLSSKMADEDVVFEYLVTVDLENVPVIYRKTEQNYQIVPNEIDQLKIRIDAILFSANQADKQQIVEFSNNHGALRQYGLPYVAKHVKANETNFVRRMTYFNYLYCFYELCDGGRYRGLIALKNRENGRIYRYFFLEDRYMRVDERILFENNGVEIAELARYKRVQNITNYPLDERGQPLPLDLHLDYYVNNFVFTNIFHAFISINHTLYYLVIENDALKISNDRVPYQGLKFGFLTFVNSDFDSKTGIGFLTITNTLTEEGIVTYEYSAEFGFEKHSVSRKYYGNRIRNPPANLQNFMQLVALLDYTENGREVRVVFFSPVVTFVFKLPVKNFKILASTSPKDAAIDLRDPQFTKVLDFNFLRCFYSFQLAKFAGSMPVPEPEDSIIKWKLNYIAYTVVAFTAVFILACFGCCFYLFKGESSRERRERLKRKLFSNKFLRFLRVKERNQRLGVVKSERSKPERSKSERSKPASSRSQWVSRFKTVKKIRVSSPSGSTKTVEGSRAATIPKMNRQSEAVYKSASELKTIDSTGAGGQRSEQADDMAPENILKFKSDAVKSASGKMRETKNKITSLMDKMNEMKKSLQ